MHLYLVASRPYTYCDYHERLEDMVYATSAQNSMLQLYPVILRQPDHCKCVCHTAYVVSCIICCAFCYPCRYSQVAILGTSYRAHKCHLMIGCDQAEDITLPTFGLLEDILLKDDSVAESEFIFVFSMSKTTRFDHHLAASEIERIPNNYQCSYMLFHLSVTICSVL